MARRHRRRSREKSKLWIYFLIGFIFVAALGVIWYGGEQGWFKFTINNMFGGDNFPTPTSIEIQDSSYWLILNVDDTSLCMGEKTTGMISSNMPNADCRMYLSIDNKAWKDYSGFQLNSYGNYQDELYMEYVGQIKFVSICCDSSESCKMSNQEAIKVNHCENDPTPNEPALTCQQIAQQHNALFYINAVSSAKECLDFAILDCQDTGKVINGYAVQGTCCYYTCEAAAPQQPVTIDCHDSDSDLQVTLDKITTTGTCHDNSGIVTDSCDGNFVKEYVCEPTSSAPSQQTCGYTSINCPAYLPGSTCSNGKCVMPTVSDCAQSCIDINLQGVNFDTGACFPYNPNGALSMAATCDNNNGVYANAVGCVSGICCCR